MWGKMADSKVKMVWYHLARNMCRLFCKLFFRVSYNGRENIPAKGAVLFVSNHQSFVDPLFCGVTLGRYIHFIARDSLFVHWFFGRVLSSVGAIPVRRGQADLKAVKAVISKLKEGGSVCLFPEATRTSDGKIAALKPGLGLLCRRGAAAIVPVVIDGAFECWPRHKKVFSPGGEITVSYGECMTAEEVKGMDDNELAERLTNTLRQMQTKVRKKQGKEKYEY